MFNEYLCFCSLGRRFQEIAKKLGSKVPGLDTNPNFGYLENINSTHDQVFTITCKLKI